MPSSWRAAPPPPITTTLGKDRDVGSPRQSPLAPPFSPITPIFSPITPIKTEPQTDDDSGILPGLAPSYYIVPRELRWLTADDEVNKFCASPDGNAGNLDGEQYLEQVLEEMEIERKFSENWRAAVEQADREQQQSGMWDPEPAGRPDQLLPHAVPAPPRAATPVVVAPRAAARIQRKRANARGGVATRKQPKRACKRKMNYKE